MDLDLETANSLITAASALFGALMGGGISAWATSRQQKREHEAELEREIRSDARKRQELAMGRAREAAVRCDDAVSQLASILIDDAHAQVRFTDDPYRTARAEAAFLPIELRERVDEALEVLFRAGHLEEHHYDGDPRSWAANVISAQLHAMVASWLNSAPLPSRSDLWCDFVLAAERVNRDHEEMYLDSIGYELEASQKSWREENAEHLAVIRTRRATESPTPRSSE